MLLDKETLMNLYSANSIDYEIGILLNLILLGDFVKSTLFVQCNISVLKF